MISKNRKKQNHYITNFIGSISFDQTFNGCRESPINRPIYKYVYSKSFRLNAEHLMKYLSIDC